MFRGFFGRFRLMLREARFIRVSLLLAAGLNLLSWLLAIWFAAPRWSSHSDFYALHYTIYFGVDRVGPIWRLGAAPLLGSAILAANFLLAAYAYVRDRVTSNFLMALCVLLEGLLLFSLFLTLLLNI